MTKPGSKVYAKSVKSIYPRFEVLKKAAYVGQFGDNPLKDVIKKNQEVKPDLTNESILIKKDEDKAYKFYAARDDSKGVLGKRTREKNGEEVYIKRKIAKYEKTGYFRFTEIDESVQEGSFLLYDIGHDQLSYLPVKSRLMLSRKREALPKKKRIKIPGMDFDDEEDEPQEDPSWKEKFYNIAEREYTEKELQKKMKNIEKGDAPYKLDPGLISQQRLEGHRIKEVYGDTNLEENQDDDDNLDLVIVDDDYAELDNPGTQVSFSKNNFILRIKTKIMMLMTEDKPQQMGKKWQQVNKKMKVKMMIFSKCKTSKDLIQVFFNI